MSYHNGTQPSRTQPSRTQPSRTQAGRTQPTLAGTSHLLAMLGVAVLLTGCAQVSMPNWSSWMASRPDYAALIAATDRDEADRVIDLRRKQPQMLAFTDVRPGMRVLDMGAGGGYTTELLARAVGKSGQVLAHNTPEMNPRGRERITERLKKPLMQSVQAVFRPYDDPLPEGAPRLDLITFFFAYHDVTFMKVDREQMNRRLFEALKPGGMLIIADHSARPGEGDSVARTLHRIEESFVRKELEQAGFRLLEQGQFLRNPNDLRDENVNRSKTPADEFVLKFVRPKKPDA